MILDTSFDHRRGHIDLVSYLTDFSLKYDKAESSAGLHMSLPCKAHLLFKWSGLPSKRISDIKLHS